jgi:DNA processing protein
MFAVAGARTVTIDIREQASLLALTESSTRPWHELAELIEEARSASAIVAGTQSFYEKREDVLARALAEATSDLRVRHWAEVIDRTLEGATDTRLVTVLDDDYPINLRKVYDRPPFLFIRGTLLEQDARSIAVVGTRKASGRGLELARDLATALATRSVTVVSGLAAGVDTAGHTAALDAGGRTIAVMGTGIDRIYPAPNARLAERIVGNGALVSQFWPGMPPRSANFLLRNVVTSGMAVGTVVVEASNTSGARHQARMALEHRKRLFLVRDLVMHEEWAQRYAKRPGAVVVDSVDDVLSVLDDEREEVTELRLF